jgi:hypothetical protein
MFKEEQLSGVYAQYLSQAQQSKSKSEMEVLRHENKKMTAHIKKLKRDMDILKTSVEGLLIDKEYSTYLVVLQDLNREFDLETHATNSIKSSIRRMRVQRAGMSNYILDDDDSAVVAMKVDLAINKLCKISPECKVKFDKKFGNDFVSRISSVIPHRTIASLASVQDKVDAEEWWADS